MTLVCLECGRRDPLCDCPASVRRTRLVALEYRDRVVSEAARKSHSPRKDTA